MERKTKILVIILVIGVVIYGIYHFLCPNRCNCIFFPRPVPPPCDSILFKYDTIFQYQVGGNGEIVVDTDGNPVTIPVIKKVPYRCNELILDGSRPDADRLRNYLSNLCFVKVSDCRCNSGGPELWRCDPNIDVDLIVVKEPPTTGGGVGGLMLNFIVEEFDANVPVTFADSSMISNIEVPTSGKPNCSGDSVKIATVDSGVDVDPVNPLFSKSEFVRLEPLSHTACNLTANTLYGLDMNPLAIQEEAVDLNGHGTAVNSIAAGLSAPAGGSTRGVKLRFLNSKFTDGTKKSGTLFHALCGLYYALEQGAEVINASWGFYSNETPLMLEKFINLAETKNVMIVAGLGNDKAYIGPAGERFWPACFANHPNVISVGAVTDAIGSKIADFSNWSFNPDVMTVSAPGDSIISAYPIHLTPTGFINTKAIIPGWAVQSGTSMSTPYVTRTVAVMKGINKKMKMGDIKNRIRSTAGNHRIYNHEPAVEWTCQHPS